VLCILIVRFISIITVVLLMLLLLIVLVIVFFCVTTVVLSLSHVVACCDSVYVTPWIVTRDVTLFVLYHAELCWSTT